MVLNFPGLLGNQDKTLQTADYRSAGSHQAENLKYKEVDNDADTWIEIHTVTTGKTFYVSGLIISTNQTTAVKTLIGTGAAASEVTFLTYQALTTAPLIMALPTPLKFASGTRISVRAADTSSHHFVLIGWEE